MKGTAFKMKSLIGKVRAAIENYKMIQIGDKIAVCISGGKDSMYLLYALNEIKKYSKVSFEIIAISLDPCFNNTEMNYSSIVKFCENNNINLIIKRTQLAQILFDIRKEKKPCSLCANMRRGILHSTAQEFGCNKVALGHHYDDAIHTFLMNLFNNGNLSCFSANAYLSRRNIHMIRPLIFCEEQKIIHEVKKLKLPIIKLPCPMDGHTERQNVKILVKELEKKYPDLKKKIFNAIKSLKNF